VFQQVTIEQNLTQKFTAHDYCMALKQHHTYREKAQCRQLDIRTHVYTVVCNKAVFEKRVMPCLHRIAEILRLMRPSIIKPLDRKLGDLGAWNHVELFPYNVTFIPDGLPYVTWQPSKWEYEVNSNHDVQELFGWTDSDVGSGQVGLRWLKSGKYKQAIMKGHLIIGLHGLILKHSAHLGMQNDTVIMDTIMEEDGRADCDDGDEEAMWELEEGEWGLGDKAYCGIRQMLCGNKPEETEFDTFWNSLVSFYRGRVEIVIAKLKKHAWCKTAFRGSYKALVAYMEIAVVMTALEIRRNLEKGESMFEVCGPWPHKFQ